MEALVPALAGANASHSPLPDLKSRPKPRTRLNPQPLSCTMCHALALLDDPRSMT